MYVIQRHAFSYYQKEKTQKKYVETVAFGALFSLTTPLANLYVNIIFNNIIFLCWIGIKPKLEAKPL